MTNNTENIPKKLGALKKGLVEEGYTEEQAFQIVLDLLRRGTDLPAVVSD